MVSRKDINMAKILVVEDDLVINQVICEFLIDSSHSVVSCSDGQDALEKFRSQDFDLIILDIMIPKISGFEVLQKVRMTSNIPIIILTAIDDETKQLYSFNHNISDYVIKPFSPLILMKRIENVLKNYSNTSYMSSGEIKIDFEKATVFSNGQYITLTKKEYEIISYLFKHKGKLVTRENLMIAVWGYSEFDTRVLDNHIKNLRKKIPQLQLTTVVGRGFRLMEK